MKIAQVFPNPIGLFDLDFDIDNQTLDYVNSLEQSKNMLNYKTINHNVLENSIFLPLKTELDEKINYFFKEIFRPSTDVKLKITISWINFTQPGMAHHLHTHYNSFLSGVYYLAVDDELDAISFSRPYHYYSNFAIDTLEPNDFTTNDIEVNVKKGMLILFPSFIPHRVLPTESTKTRISLSFNTFFSGEIGNTKDLTLLRL